MQTWVEQELATAAFGDKRLDERFRVVVDRMSQKPSLKFPAACKGRAEIEAAYRFLDNDRVDAAKVLAPHGVATLQRIREQAVVILAQDTTELEVTRKHERMDGAGPLSDGSRLGFFDHVVLAMTAEKVVLGVVDAKIWARIPRICKRVPRRNARHAEAKRSKTRKAAVGWTAIVRRAAWLKRHRRRWSFVFRIVKEMFTSAFWKVSRQQTNARRPGSCGLVKIASWRQRTMRPRNLPRRPS